jgi:hypothetical protein
MKILIKPPEVLIKSYMNREEHLILRIPEDWTSKMNSEARLEFSSVDMNNEEAGRVFQVRLGNSETMGFLLDLPT